MSSLVTRAIKLSSTDEARKQELCRVTQVLINNGYPQSLVDTVIQNKLRQMCHHHDEPANEEPPSDIDFFVQLHKVSTFKEDTKRLKTLLDQHVIPTDSSKKVKLTTFYRPMKLSAKFSTRPMRENPEKSCLVYQFECPIPSCHEVQYYGYTNQRLCTRVKQHRRKDSAICRHYMDVHNDMPPKFVDFINCFTILYKDNDILSVKIAEAIMIKNDKPIINIKYNELYDFLNLY